MKKKIIKVLFAVLMAAIVLFLSFDIYRQYQRKIALTEQLAKVEVVQKQLQEEQAKRDAQYQEDLAKWKEKVKQIERQNKGSLDRYERRTKETKRITLVDNVPVEKIERTTQYIRVPTESSDGVVDQIPEPILQPVPEPVPEAAPMPPPAAMVVQENVPVPQLQSIPEPPAPPSSIQLSADDGLRVELNNTTSWNTILQLIFTLLASYLGIKLINKHVRD